MFVGPFEDLNRPDIAMIEPRTGNVALITGLSNDEPTVHIVSSGGLDPISAISLLGSNGYEDLVIANRGDGQVSLLEGGPNGLGLEEVNYSLSGPSPTGLALASIQSNTLAVFASTEGADAASLLLFSSEFGACRSRRVPRA